MTQYRKLAALGDSFSTADYGQSWPDHVSRRLGAELVRACSSGAGNAFYVEKLHDIVKDPEVDLVIVQLTEPSRVVIGMRAWEEVQQNLRPHPIPAPKHYHDPTHNNIYKDMGCYTLNVHENKYWLGKMVDYDLEQFDRFWLDQCAGARFWQYQTLHNMLAMKALCSEWKKRLIFFSWFVDWDDLFLPDYSWLRGKLAYERSLIKGVGREEGERRQLPYTHDGHYGTEASETLVREWLWPELERLL